MADVCWPVPIECNREAGERETGDVDSATTDFRRLGPHLSGINYQAQCGHARRLALNPKLKYAAQAIRPTSDQRKSRIDS